MGPGFFLFFFLFIFGRLICSLQLFCSLVSGCFLLHHTYIHDSITRISLSSPDAIPTLPYHLTPPSKLSGRVLGNKSIIFPACPLNTSYFRTLVLTWLRAPIYFSIWCIYRKRSPVPYLVSFVYRALHYYVVAASHILWLSRPRKRQLARLVPSFSSRSEIELQSSAWFLGSADYTGNRPADWGIRGSASEANP